MPRTAILPGEHLAEEFGITAAELSRQIDVPVNREAMAKLRSGRSESGR